MTRIPEHDVIISGIGQSEVGRRLHRTGIDLTVDAALEAIEDAGLTRDDIDGLASYPGDMARPKGFSGPGTPAVHDALRLELSWHRAGREGPAQFSAIIDAVAAVSMGLARHVLVYRTVTEATAQAGGGRSGIGLDDADPGGKGGRIPRVGAELAYLLPFGAFSAANWTAWYCRRYMHEYGLTREQLAWVALNARRHAALNDNAVYRDELALDDYLDARMISTPLCLYDCDAPADGSTALIVSHADHADDLPHPAVRFEAVGSAIRGRPFWEQWDDMTTMAGRDAGAHLWTRTDLTPADVDVAELYDGFSWLTLMWLEALGLVGKGEAGEFVDGGKRIGLEGELPLNTQGGQLSGGRLHGFGFAHEAVLQLRHEAGERQVPGEPEIAVVAAGGGTIAGCLLLSRHR